MSGGSLLLLMLLVSWTSLVLQAAALVHLWRQRNDPGKLAGHGYARTAACRVLAAALYVTVALLQVTGVKVPGGGGLSPEALTVFTAVQFIWLINSAMDIRVRRQLSREQDDDGNELTQLPVWCSVAWCTWRLTRPGRRSRR